MTKMTIKCPECGGIEFEYPDEMEDNSIITCTGCGESRTKAALVEHANQQAKELLSRTFGDRFKPK
ncbi:hypothetical protein A6D6_02672 [Alcanivorax xiamenensis]|uniref:Uncharacterized protein n=1 Tax=Alcanivorax xiamenensis TaxID=1177156 RepID=A0ABQ6Y6D2_9GAMM|nr:hypothetical protein A6D6_02672 [Alcanivorax xiamenensis]